MATDPVHQHPDPQEPDQEGLFDAQMSLPLPFVAAPEPFSTVLKRNGREEPFDRAKITNAIFRAAQSIGGEDRDLADSLARAVTIYLTKQLGSHVPSVDHIHDAVERVLIQMAHIRTAFAYARYRDRRARVRRLREGDMRLLLGELEEARQRGNGLPRDGEGLFVRTSADTIATWNRERIVDALVRETGLEQAMAEVIAAEVEQQIESARIQHLSSVLIRELVAARLVAHGLHEFRDRHQRLGVPLYDCERIIRGLTEVTVSRDPVATDYVLAGAVKKEYALARIYSPQVSEAHLQGAIHLHDLEKVDRLQRATLSPGMVARFGVGMPGAPEFASPPRNAVTFLAQIAKATAVFQALFAGPLAWDAVNYYLAPYVRGYTPVELSQFAQMIVYEFAYRAMAHGGDGPRPELCLAWMPPRRLAEVPAVGSPESADSKCYRDYEHTAQQLAWKLFEVLKACAGLHVSPPVLGLRVDERFFKSPGADAFLALAAGAATTGFTFRVHFERGPEISGQRHDWKPSDAVFDQVSLNLPRLAYSHPSEQRFLVATDQLVGLAGLALQERRNFLESLLVRESAGPMAVLSVRHAGAPLLALDDAVGVVAVHGLSEAVQHLSGAPLSRASGSCEMGVRLLTRLQEKCRIESRKRGFSVQLGQGTDRFASGRFATLDAESHPEPSIKTIKIDEETKRLHYTSGVSLDSDHDLSPFERAQIEGSFHGVTDRPEFMRVTLPSSHMASTSVADLVNKVYHQTSIGGIEFCCR